MVVREDVALARVAAVKLLLLDELLVVSADGDGSPDGALDGFGGGAFERPAVAPDGLNVGGDSRALGVANGAAVVGRGGGRSRDVARGRYPSPESNATARGEGRTRRRRRRRGKHRRRRLPRVVRDLRRTRVFAGEGGARQIRARATTRLMERATRDLNSSSGLRLLVATF